MVCSFNRFERWREVKLEKQPGKSTWYSTSTILPHICESYPFTNNITLIKMLIYVYHLD